MRNRIEFSTERTGDRYAVVLQLWTEGEPEDWRKESEEVFSDIDLQDFGSHLRKLILNVQERKQTFAVSWWKGGRCMWLTAAQIDAIKESDVGARHFFAPLVIERKLSQPKPERKDDADKR